VSNNNTLIAKLAENINTFEGTTLQTRCFAHITNLSAKSFAHTFNPLKKSKDKSKVKADNNNDIVNNKVDDVAGLNEGWVDKVEEMSDFNREVLEEEVVPLRTVLKKVSI
jgi:hypothetical protein